LAVLEHRVELAVRNRPPGGREVVHLRQAEEQQQGEPVPDRRGRPGADRALSPPLATARIEPRITFGWHALAVPLSGYALTGARFSNVSPSRPAPTVTTSPSRNSPSSTRSASGSRTRR